MTAAPMNTDHARQLHRIGQLRAELDAVEAALPALHDVQYLASPALKSAPSEVGRSATPERPADPTGDAAADPNRLHVRDVLGRCEDALTAALVQVAGVHRGLTRALRQWEGDEAESPNM